MFFLKFKFSPVWKDIVNIRNFIIAMLSSKITDYTSAYRVGLVASELIENVCKYSAVGGASLEMEQNNNNPEFFLRLRNVTDQKAIGQLKEVHEMIYKGSAKKVYKKMMLRSLHRDISKQLGLARIRYEGQAEISFIVESDIRHLIDPYDLPKAQDKELVVLCVQIKTILSPQKQKGETDGD